MVALDTSIPEDLQCHYEHLPLPYQVIPSSVQSLSDCAKWQIESMPEEEEDALDDGFILCDVHVIVKKLQAWRHLFPRIKPFFALKCNPDPMVAAGEYKS